MKIGKGKYRIDPVTYFKKCSLVLTRPKWFYETFFPKIPVEVTYTIMGLMVLVGASINYVHSVFTGGGILSFLPILLHAGFFTVVGACLSFAFYFLTSLFLNPIDKEPKALWKLACFSMSLNGLAVSITVGGWYGVLISIVLFALLVWFYAQTMLYFFRAPNWLVYLYLAFTGLAMLSMVVTFFTLVT